MADTKTIEPLVVTREYDGVRLDKFIQHHVPTATFGMVQKLCRKGQIRLAGKRVKGNERVEKGQEVRVPPTLFSAAPKHDENAEKAYTLTAQEKRTIDGLILYEDDTCVVLNKPYGTPVQAGSGHTKSLDRMMVAYYEGDKAPKLVHRLDRDTTGVLLFAKGRDNAAYYGDQFKDRSTQKTYWALVEGKLNAQEGVINTLLEKTGASGGEKMSETDTGKRAVTEYRVIGSAKNFHWLEVTPKTGRTHQIRAHLASIGVPIVGDGKYGGVRFKSAGVSSSRMFLHARALTLHSREEEHFFEAPLPKHFQQIFDLFVWQEKDA